MVELVSMEEEEKSHIDVEINRFGYKSKVILVNL